MSPSRGGMCFTPCAGYLTRPLDVTAFLTLIDGLLADPEHETG